MWKTKRSHSSSPPLSVVKDQEEQTVQFEATQLWDAMVAHLERNISPGRRRRSFRWYQDCFHGSEAVDCLKMFFTKVLQRTGVERQQFCTLLGRFNSWGVIEAVTSRDQNSAFRECNLYRLTYQHFWRSEERDMKNKSLRRSNSIPSLAPGDLADDSGLNSPSSIQSTSSEEKMKTLPRTCSSFSLDHGFQDDDLLDNEVEETHKVSSNSGSREETLALEPVPSPPEAKERVQSWQCSQQRDSEAARRGGKGGRRMETSGKRITRQRSMLEHQRANLKLSKRMSGSYGTLSDDPVGESLATTNSGEDCTRLHPKADVESKRPSNSKGLAKRQETTETGKKSSFDEELLSSAAKWTNRRAERHRRQQDHMTRHQARNSMAHVMSIQERGTASKPQSCQNGTGAVKTSTSRDSNYPSSRRKHCDLYRRLAASGQLSCVPVAYGDFGALAVSDVVWQQFCFSQDPAGALGCSSVGVLNSASSQLETDMQIVRYGFV